MFIIHMVWVPFSPLSQVRAIGTGRMIVRSTHDTTPWRGVRGCAGGCEVGAGEGGGGAKGRRDLISGDETVEVKMESSSDETRRMTEPPTKVQE
jgi:hypothetical protein